MDSSTTSPLIPQLLIRSAVPFYSTPDFPLQCKHQAAGPYIKARETERDEVQSPAACEHFLGCSFFSDITWVYSCDHLSNGGVFRFGEESDKKVTCQGTEWCVAAPHSHRLSGSSLQSWVVDGVAFEYIFVEGRNGIITLRLSSCVFLTCGSQAFVGMGKPMNENGLA